MIVNIFNIFISTPRKYGGGGYMKNPSWYRGGTSRRQRLMCVYLYINMLRTVPGDHFLPVLVGMLLLFK